MKTLELRLRGGGRRRSRELLDDLLEGGPGAVLVAGREELLGLLEGRLRLRVLVGARRTARLDVGILRELVDPQRRALSASGVPAARRRGALVLAPGGQEVLRLLGRLPRFEGLQPALFLREDAGGLEPGLRAAEPGELLLQRRTRFGRARTARPRTRGCEARRGVATFTGAFARSICFFASSSILARIASACLANGVSFEVVARVLRELDRGRPVLLLDLRARPRGTGRGSASAPPAVSPRPSFLTALPMSSW